VIVAPWQLMRYASRTRKPAPLPEQAHGSVRPLMIKNASAIWKGSLNEGGGTISTETGVLRNAPYGFKSRFENGKGTNPEELIGAAHAGCFSMALSLMLGQAGFTPDKIETRAAISLDKVGEGFEITSSHLEVVAKVPGITADKFIELANQAKAGCPVSKLLKAKITMNAKLEA
jgi:osmotically inducible protein OsmC